MHTDWNEAAAAAFRRQLALSPQRELFSHWCSMAAKAGGWPRREDLRVRQLWKMLPNLLLLRLQPMPAGIEVRMAGSALWEIHGGEITGHTLEDGTWGRHAGYWREVYAMLHEAPRPMQGHLRLCGEEDPACPVLFWMRLPLLDKGGDIWLLGLDIAMPAARWDTLPPEPAGDAAMPRNAA